ncbi:MAG TPA: MotA/TolQ/ExbB proton channel family protein [Vicinamibacteria bacterium]|nr:MotA/TolQ/ExbB proton channel family protein [Vicinamibacteria bacterium]
MNFILQAGPLLWPIVLCSVIGFAIFLDRAYALYRFGSGQRKLVPQVVLLVAQGKVEDASSLCRENRGPIMNVLGTSLRSRDLSSEEREQILTVSGNRELHDLERGLRGIAVIARIAPLLGLLGTVVGLVEAFLAVSTMQGPPDPSVLASGIWQALLTTVAGLVVAIPAIVSHEWLQSRIDALALAMEEALAEVASFGASSPASDARRNEA